MMIRISKHLFAVTGCAIVAAVVSAATHADEKKAMDAMDTCIQTFVTEELPAGRKIEIVKREMTPLNSAPLLLSSQRTTRIEVSAKTKRSRKRIASATCVLDRNDRLVAMYVQGERIQLAAGEELSTSPGG
jgi:hypothetical protein